MRKILLSLAIAMASISCGRIDILHINNRTAEFELKEGQTIILPMEDDAPEALLIFSNDEGQIGTPWTARLAIDTVDYYIPYTAKEDLSVRIENLSFEAVFFSCLKTGKPKYYNPSPSVHFRPPYGWTNDPNGMFYKDGLWHLYYQFNPFGSKWGNMTWGHSVTEDLVNWKHMPVAIEPDELGMIFSGSAAVNGDEIVAMYTSAGTDQSQSIAFSNDDGLSFSKYECNPVLTSDRPDFRDPKLFYCESTGRWCAILAAGDAMEIYSTDDFITWNFESRFGEGIGCHGGVWECPDLFSLPYEGGEKWILVCSCNKSAEFGAATQYFIGSFDGHDFIPDDTVERWFDYGKDNYAGVTWFGAPQGRRVMLGWLSNWKYADSTQDARCRGMMTCPRELSLCEYDGKLVVKSFPAAEFLEGAPKDVLIEKTLTAEAPEMELYGMKLALNFDESTFSITRTDGTFSIKLEGRDSHSLLVVAADDAVECFIDDGAAVMTCLAL